MMEDVIQFRLDDKTHDMIDYDTPSTIPCNIATIDRLSKEDIISRHKSRFPSHSQQITQYLYNHLFTTYIITSASYSVYKLIMPPVHINNL